MVYEISSCEGCPLLVEDYNDNGLNLQASCALPGGPVFGPMVPDRVPTQCPLRLGAVTFTANKD